MLFNYLSCLLCYIYCGIKVLLNFLFTCLYKIVRHVWKYVVLGVSLRVMSRGPEERRSRFRVSAVGFSDTDVDTNFLVTMAETNIPFKPCIIVHGGAGNIPIPRREPVLCAVTEAVKIGYRVLLEVRSVPQIFLAISLHCSS